MANVSIVYIQIRDNRDSRRFTNGSCSKNRVCRIHMNELRMQHVVCDGDGWEQGAVKVELSSVLSSLSSSCISLRKDYWEYELCFGSSIKQKGGGDTYVLGTRTLYTQAQHAQCNIRRMYVCVCVCVCVCVHMCVCVCV